MNVSVKQESDLHIWKLQQSIGNIKLIYKNENINIYFFIIIYILLIFLTKEMIKQYLASIFASLRIASTYHAFSHIQVSMLKPRIAQFTIHYRNLDFIYSWLVLRHCGITCKNLSIYITTPYTRWNTNVRVSSKHQNNDLTLSWQGLKL